VHTFTQWRVGSLDRLGYLDMLSPRTVEAYRAALKEFFQVVYRKGEPLEELADRYFLEEQSHEENLRSFLKDQKEKKRAPKSIQLKLSAVRVFLAENGVELPQRFWKRLRSRLKGSRPLTLDKIPTPSQLRRIVSHLPVKGKALFLILASSGARIGEVIGLSLDDVDLESDPPRLEIRNTKTGNPRVVFISREAKEAVEHWLYVRKNYYLKTVAGRTTRAPRPREDNRLFPFTIYNAYGMWNNALRKAGLAEKDPKTNYHKYHPHVLRKFFRTRLGSEIPVEVVETLMGHEGYLTDVYRRYGEEELARYYKEGEHALLIFTETRELAELKRKVDERYQQLQSTVNSLLLKNTDLERRLRELTEEKERLRVENEKISREVEDTTKLIREWESKFAKYLELEPLIPKLIELDSLREMVSALLKQEDPQFPLASEEQVGR